MLAPWVARIPHPYQLLVRIFVLRPLTIFGAIILILAFILIFAIIFSPVIVVTWAIIEYGVRRHSSPEQCSDRYTDRGFVGNPDFYGLGIRIGIYLQWLGSLMANAFLP